MPKRHRHRQSLQPSPTVEKPSAVASTSSRANPQPQELAALLWDASRVRPVVVISRFADEEQPRLDGDSIAIELKGVADVVVITNGQYTYELEGLLPADTHIFGSAARVYPPGLKWTENPYSSPLRLVRNRSDIEPVTAKIVTDAEEFAFAGGWKTASQVSKGNPREYGLVKSVAPDGSRAVVELSSGLQAFLPEESTGIGVPLHWILREGISISGTFDTGKRIFSIATIELPVPGDGYADGCVVPALVQSVGTRSADLSLAPGRTQTVELSSISSNERDSADDLLTVGEVVSVRLYRRSGQVLLSMLDVDDSEPVLNAPELIPGGGPWLVLGRDLVQRITATAPALVSPPAHETPDESPTAGAKALRSTELALATERTRGQQLEAELQRLQAANHQYQVHADQLDADVMISRQQAAELSGVQQEVDRLRRDLAATNKQLSELRKKLRGVRKEEATPERAFLDPEQDFDFLLNYTWAVQIPAAEKNRLTLGRYRIGEDFLRSLREQPKEKQKKAFKAIVDLLVNDPAKLSARETHQLRTNASGGSAVMTRNNGHDLCWRLSIEQNVAAARRLHYWKCADGVVELSRVTVHDGTEA